MQLSRRELLKSVATTAAQKLMPSGIGKILSDAAPPPHAEFEKLKELFGDFVECRLDDIFNPVGPQCVTVEKALLLRNIPEIERFAREFVENDGITEHESKGALFQNYLSRIITQWTDKILKHYPVKASAAERRRHYINSPLSFNAFSADRIDLLALRLKHGSAEPLTREQQEYVKNGIDAISRLGLSADDLNFMIQMDHLTGRGFLSKDLPLSDDYARVLIALENHPYIRMKRCEHAETVEAQILLGLPQRLVSDFTRKEIDSFNHFKTWLEISDYEYASIDLTLQELLETADQSLENFARFLEPRLKDARKSELQKISFHFEQFPVDDGGLYEPLTSGLPDMAIYKAVYQYQASDSARPSEREIEKSLIGRFSDAVKILSVKRNPKTHITEAILTVSWHATQTDITVLKVSGPRHSMPA